MIDIKPCLSVNHTMYNPYNKYQDLTLLTEKELDILKTIVIIAEDIE